jgi:hypothetical protein
LSSPERPFRIGRNQFGSGAGKEQAQAQAKTRRRSAPGQPRAGKEKSVDAKGLAHASSLSTSRQLRLACP